MLSESIENDSTIESSEKKEEIPAGHYQGGNLMNTQTAQPVQFTPVYQGPAKKFKVQETLKSIRTLTDLGAIALVQKYNQAEDWENEDAYEYALSLYLAALAGSISHDEEMENLIEDCNLRMLNGISGCICGNHRDFYLEESYE